MGKRASLGADWGGVSGFVGKKMGRGRSKSPKKSVPDDSNPAPDAGGPEPSALYLPVSRPTPPPKDYEAEQGSTRVDSTHRSEASDAHQRANSRVRWASSLRQSEDSTRFQTGRTSMDQLSFQHQSHHHYGVSRSQSQADPDRLGAPSPDEIRHFEQDESDGKTNNALAGNSSGNQIWSGAAITDDSFTPPFPSGEKSTHDPQNHDNHYDDDLSFYHEDDYMAGAQARSIDEPLRTGYLEDASGPLDAHPSISNMAETSQQQVPMPDPTKDYDPHGPRLSAASKGSFFVNNPRSGLTPAPLNVGAHKRMESYPGVRHARYSPQAAEFHGFPIPSQSSDWHPAISSLQPSRSERRAPSNSRTTGAMGVGDANDHLAKSIEQLPTQTGDPALPYNEQRGAQTAPDDMNDPDELEYTPDELQHMPYDTLRKAPFDPKPFQSPQSPSTAAIPLDSLSTQLASKLHSSPDEQADLFASLTLKQWEEAGDWFIQKFSDQMKRMVELRKEKRRREEELEQEVARRHDEIARKKTQIDEAIGRMRADGGKILRQG